MIVASSTSLSVVGVVPMDGLLEAADDLGLSDVLGVLVAQLTRVVIVGPCLRDLDAYELDDDVHRLDVAEVVGEVGADAERGLYVALGVALYGDGRVGVEGVGEDHLLGLRVDAQRLVLVDDLHQLLMVVAAVDAQALEQHGEVLGEVEREDVPSEGVVEIGAQCAAEGVAPGLHGQVVGHLRAVHATDGTDELVGHRADGRQIVLHGEVDIAGAYELAGPLSGLVAVLHRTHEDILGLEGEAAARAEVAVGAACLKEAAGLLVALTVVGLIVDVVLSGDHIVELGHDGKDLHLEKDGVRPGTLDLDMQVALLVLPAFHPLTRIAESLEIGEEPLGDVIALALHEGDLLIGDDHVLEHGHLLHHQLVESLGIGEVVAVDKAVLHLGAREVVDDGAAHGELVEVVVGEMRYDLSHLRIMFFKPASKIVIFSKNNA